MKQSYRWPTKLAKFGITDPFLMLLVAKYENEIPWHKERIEDEQSLGDYVSQQMLPKQLKRITWPAEKGSKHCFISARHVNLELALQTDLDIDQEDMEIIGLIKQENGKEEASIALAQIVNQRKVRAFSEWKTLLTTTYATNSALCVLLLRPLLEGCGPQSRRSIMPPSDDVIDWLTRRIKNQSLLPSENIAKLYAWKVSAGNNYIPMNGWQYIPSSSEYAARLAAATAGSGWCIGDIYWARYYLRDYGFYLLRHAGKAVVALRVSGCNVVECQGQHNKSPMRWFGDIDLFVRSQDMQLQDRRGELSAYLEKSGNSDVQEPEWWKLRANYWPFSLALSPTENRQKTIDLEVADYAQYSGFPRFNILLKKCGVSLKASEWREMMLIDPSRYSIVPKEYRDNPDIVDGCVSGWVQRLQYEQTTLLELRGVPEFVSQHASFNEALQTSFLECFKSEARRRPATRSEREHQFDLDTVLPPSSIEATELAIERLVNKLLRNETSDFSDLIFPAETRAHADFAELRIKAWEEAVAAQPPMWFALPEDLATRKCFELNQGDVTRVDLDSWEQRVLKRPWLLTQKAGVPKSVRMHKRIIDAYFLAWMEIRVRNPMVIWKKVNKFRRVYMSYALLANPRTMSVLTEFWKTHRSDMDKFWFKGSDRMRGMPVMQLSVLRALGTTHKSTMQIPAYRIVKDIDSQRIRKQQSGPLNVYEEEIERRLISAGFGAVLRNTESAF